MAMKPFHVFTPNSFPTHTYVERGKDRLEARLAEALATPGQVVSLSGPSKSGKTVLVRQVVGDYLISISGAKIESAEELWDRVLDWMRAPYSTAKGKSKGLAITLPPIEGNMGRDESATFRRRGLDQVAEELADSEFVLLIDDFHYMPRSIQGRVAKQIKAAAEANISIVTASVPHRGDDVVRSNPELRGRVLALDLDYWEPGPLRKIADIGFSLLGIKVSRDAVEEFVRESAGSPQLMQAICLQACFELQDAPVAHAESGKIELSRAKLQRIFERTVPTADFRSLVQVLDSGPKTRGTERNEYDFQDGTSGDVYSCILKLIALDPPRLAFDYDELRGRAGRLCVDDEPVGSSLIGACQQMARLATDRFPEERAIDWDEERFVLDIPDPYLLFYLRWSGYGSPDDA